MAGRKQPLVRLPRSGLAPALDAVQLHLQKLYLHSDDIRTLVVSCDPLATTASTTTRLTGHLINPIRNLKFIALAVYSYFDAASTTDQLQATLYKNDYTKKALEVTLTSSSGAGAYGGSSTSVVSSGNEYISSSDTWDLEVTHAAGTDSWISTRAFIWYADWAPTMR